MKKNLQNNYLELGEFNPGLVGEKQVCYLCAMQPPLLLQLKRILSLSCQFGHLQKFSVGSGSPSARSKVFGERLAKAKKEIFLSSAFLAGKESTPVFLFWFAFFVRQSRVAICFSAFDFWFVAKRKERGEKIFSSTELLASPKTWFNSTFLFFWDTHVQHSFGVGFVFFFPFFYVPFCFGSCRTKNKTRLFVSEREKKLWVHICFIKLSCWAKWYH